MSLITLGADGGKTPIAFVHALSGSILPYVPLIEALGNGSPVYGLEVSELDGTRQPSSDVSLLAHRYQNEIQAHVEAQRLTVVGWSFGGILAAELAARLNSSGFVTSVILIDVQRLNASRPNRNLDSDEELVEFGRLMLSGSGSSLIRPPTLQEIRALPARLRVGHLFDVIVSARPMTKYETLHNFLRVFRANLAAHDLYVPSPIRRVDALFVRSEYQCFPDPDPSLGWNHWFPDGIETTVANGDHESVLDPSNVEKLAGLILEWQRRH